MIRILFIGLILVFGTCFAQEVPSSTITLKLDEAMQIGLNQNKKILSKKVTKEISESKQKVLFNEQLPEIEAHYRYNRMARLRQYQNGGFAGGPTKYFLARSQYELDGTAVLPLYKGGKLQREKKIARAETEIAEIGVEKAEQDVKLRVVSSFLNMYSLQEHLKVVLDHINEDNVMVNHIKNLEKNGVVTYNEILRAELQLKQDSLEYVAITNDIKIANEEIKFILSAPEENNYAIDTTGLVSETRGNLDLKDLMKQSHHANQNLKMGEKEIKVKQLEIKAQKSDYLPTINLVAHAKLSYPNYMFFPPENFAYTFGFLGLDIKWNLTGIYTNREKVKIQELKLEYQELEHEELEEEVNFEVKRAYTKYVEAQEKIDTYDKAVAQAKENYRIVKNKYTNQLSLITELIDADNTLLETESKFITAKIEKQFKYYQLQYIIGTL